MLLSKRCQVVASGTTGFKTLAGRKTLEASAPVIVIRSVESVGRENGTTAGHVAPHREASSHLHYPRPDGHLGLIGVRLPRWGAEPPSFTDSRPDCHH